MAARPSTTAASAPAPWRAKFLDHVSKLDSPTFTFASLHPAEGGSSTTPVPRARTCVFRGMWASIPWNDKNTAPRNPDAFESECLTLTTDARMAKVPELFQSGDAGRGGGGGGGGSSSSGGGGPVEAMFWVAETGTQWRIRGHAWVLAHDDMADGSGSPGAKAARDAISARMRRTGRAGAGQWSWENEVVGQFGNLSPGMRGSFKNPPPGTPRAGAPGPGPGEGLGQKVGDELLGDDVARRNFRVVVIVPQEVDTWDGKDPEDQRRYVYTFVGPDAAASKPGGEVIDGWEKVEVWP